MHGHWLKGYLRDGKEIEGGGSGSGGPLVVTLSGDKKTADKTFVEIAEAIGTGRGAVAISPSEGDLPNNSQYQPFVSVTFGMKGIVATYVTFGTTGEPAAHASVNTDADASDYPEFDRGLS